MAAKKNPVKCRVKKQSLISSAEDHQVVENTDEDPDEVGV